jgi:toxin-antitoxin system PIN domain toxin
MLMPDVNVLVYAHRADERDHRAYKKWLEGLVNGPEPFALSVLVAVGFTRVVTNERIYRKPMPIHAALADVERLVAHPRCRLAAPGRDHWVRFVELCRATGATGKVVADAHHAAIAISEGCTWVTRDRDFRRFAAHGLRWEHLELS